MAADLSELGHVHQDAKWPESLGGSEGQLMMLDTVIIGCINYYMEEKALDPQRVGILEDSLSDLESLLPDLSDDAAGYFMRLRKIGTLLLDTVSGECR